jgi:hypothetical protein
MAISKKKKKKATCKAETQAQLATFFIKHHVYLNEKLKPNYAKVIMNSVFGKRNDSACHMKENN